MRPRHLDKATLDQALTKLSTRRDNPWALSAELLVRSGARTHELLAIQANDVNVTKGQIQIRGAKGSNDRVVPVDKGCLLAIERGLRLGIMPWQQYAVASYKALLRRHWALLRIDLLGVGLGHCSVHGLRASFAVRVYLECGRDILLVKELLGHKSIENTLKYLRLIQVEEKQQTILKAFKTKRLKAS